MPNDLLTAAIHKVGLDIVDVADIAGVDPRTVQRWLGGRIPHPSYRTKLAVALQVREQDLWPETGRARGRAALGEIVAAFPRRSDPDAPDWRALLRRAERHVDMLGYSLQHVTGARQISKLLAAKAREGCQIRIALANPGSQAAVSADQQERPPGRLVSRIRASRERLQILADETAIGLREHQRATTHTILRFDEQMLVTIHLHGTPGFQAPLLQLHREHDYGLFDQFAKHFEDVWQTAQPIMSTPSTAAAAAPDSTAERDKFLDELDNVWRPGS